VKPDPTAELRMAMARQEPEEIPEPVEPDEPVLAGTVLNPGMAPSALWQGNVRVGGSAISTRMRLYIKKARTRNLVWHLTTTEFKYITARDCHYCGSPPDNLYWHAGKLFTYSGIDRVDNRQGYTPDNCVPCCKRCNFAKGELSAKEFLEWAHRLVNHSLPLHEAYQHAKTPKHPVRRLQGRRRHQSGDD
jgi:5-methylcytosine-specific restriction endonuclease McrA